MDSKSFIETLAKRLGTDEDSIVFLTSALARSLTRACADGQSVAIAGFGTFEAKVRRERIAQHPATGHRVLLPPKTVLQFKPSAVLKQKVKDFSGDLK